MSSIKQYMHFVKPYKWKIFWTVLVGILKFGIPLLMPLILKFVIDNIIGNEALSQTEKTTQLVWLMGAAFIIFLVLRPPIEYIRQYLAQWVGNKVLFDIRDRLFDHLQRLSLKFYSKTKTGEIISRVIHDVEQTKTFVITGLMNIWLDLITILIAIGIMLSMDIELTIVAIILFPLFGFSIKYFYGRLRKLTRKRSQALAEVQGHLHERVQGMPVTRSFALEEYEQEQFNKRNSNFLTRALEHTNWNAKTFAVTNTITDLAPLLVIAYAGYQVIHGTLTMGTMVAFVGYMERVYSPLRRLINSSTTLVQSIASIDRVFELMNEKYDIQDQPDAIKVKDLHGEVVFEDVYFQYENDENTVLKGVSLHVKAGETIALVGMSGGGKSTLVSLIPRFYDVTSGTIKVDGIDVRHMQARSLRDQIGMVLQDNTLFSESIAMNIRMGKPHATDEEVMEAAKAANAHAFIQQLPYGYDTLVGERGVKLSGGQKQRIAIARVFLKNPPMLIFDEATSALDLESEHTIQEAVEKLASNRTTFIVAHRLATITHADRIVVMEDGEIKEVGRHDELMRQQGIYYNLYQVQHLDTTV
ncbi:ABC transporter ATP-binding protein/permease [Virgibacillus pantothenticus]|uniref:ABC transporter ATP-binding protein n=1 Tax=Virgibacillus pantothenticus TaxID=1473 RepID=UPI001C24EB3E|nr:ABC transporter ATP-binding protein [Virgibacillus pantothenticus]MBU8567304.1 ABC transporter ATP-binding protein/permease [Virgibacillus pantothenticus]MBU8600060.1 ABC transporter ATP-binding protein/permease [Virgibacillus pantothenticus]MBU8635359.1 ABC transporter ATP-binding protein/permease [Virgibacillus pantothenticus]MBU8642356.1 ABC transporter ATP-binding protein/permease [Virgibacillus pantothenticus]MBU8646207.1 ABC transporter ATP-binding protein/permease [Virgibacillus pant